MQVRTDSLHRPYIKVDDPAIVSQLRKAADEGSIVIVRCAKLEIEGRVGNLQFANANGRKDAIAISIDDLPQILVTLPGGFFQ
jgi:hypothetical protein